ncbi:MAG TPA: glycosyltransferase family 1 protein [Bryobacteraceae bacterium]|nr:glycosyltransferase family 1 protein [Bryobacteraceae bacterium]
MRVALDATALALTAGGLARYTAELSRALADCYPEDDFVLLSDQEFAMPAPWRRNLRAGGRPRNVRERRWWLWGLQRAMQREQSQLFHGMNFEVPYIPIKPSVVTVHDLSPWMNPDWHRAADRVRRRTPPLLGLRIATMIITPTQAVRAQVIGRFRVSASCVVAVPHGASDVFRPVATRVTSPAPYFLYVGTLEPRKNLAALIEAWREVRQRNGVDLVLAGRKRVDFTELPAEPGLRLTGEVSDDALAQLYSGALALVYPSHYEGFGLPVLEAMQCGACVLISKDTALREVAGEAGVSLDGTRAWVEAMCAAAGNPEWRNQQRSKSVARAREFSWERTAQLTYDVYQEALKRF